MRFLFLALDVDLSRPAGDATHVRELALGLVELGHSVSLVVQRGGVPASEETGLRIHTSARPGTWRMALTASRIARQERAQVIYERRPTPKVGFVASRLRHLPLFVEINGFPDEERRILGTAAPHRFSAFRKATRGFLLRRATGIVAVSPAIQAALIGAHGISEDKVVVIPNGVNTRLFRPMDQEEARRRLGVPAQRFVLGFAGHLTPWQGLDLMLRAVAALRHDGVDVTAIVVGDGPDRARLRSLAESLRITEHVAFTGGVPYEDVPGYIATFDVAFAVRPALLPGSPLKVREYMACARPVIASAGTAYDFGIVEEAGAGVLVDPSRVDAIEQGVLAFMRDLDAARRMGSAGRAFVERNCTWIATAERVAEVCAC